MPVAVRSVERILAIALLLSLPGCGDDDGAGGASDADSDGDSDADPGAALVGSWGQLAANAMLTDTGIALLGQQWSASRAWQLVEITSDGAGDLTLTETPCLAKVKTGGGALSPAMEIPQNTIDHMPATERHVAVTSSEAGTPFVSDTVYSMRGANPCDPENDPVPTGPVDANDSTSCDQACGDYQCDQDEDGHPGITSHMSAASVVDCDVYVAVRGWSAFTGEIADADTISGAIGDHGSEQEVLAATQALCANADATVADDGCAAHSYFKMVRLAAGATCADVLALTDCDDDAAACDTNDALALDPNDDTQNGAECE